MKNKKRLIILITSIIGGIILLITLFFLFSNPNRLSSKEKSWLKKNKGVLTDIRLPNDVNTFGIDGSGVYFDYLNYFMKERGFEFNIVPYTYGSITPGIAFKVANEISPNDISFFEDHYVVVSKTEEVMNNVSSLAGKKVGVIATDLSYISNYLNQDKITFETFNNIPNLVESLVSLDYVILPLNYSIKYILEKDYNICFHLSDIKQYYFLRVENNEILSNIMEKDYNVWAKSNFNDSYYEHLSYAFQKGLKLDEADLHSLTSKEYRYGIVEQGPYEVLSGNKYGGIISEYINGFVNMSKIDVKYSKYKTYDNLNSVANKNRLDLFFSYTDLANKFTPINSSLTQEYDIITKNTNKTIINSLGSLKGKTVYILENTALSKYFKSLEIATIKTYKNYNDLFSLAKKDNVIIVDSVTFNYHNNRKLKNMVTKYKGEVLGQELIFKSNLDSTFNRLFKNYIRFVDGDLIKATGLENYDYVLNTNSIFSTIIKYVIYISVSTGLILILFFKYKNKIRISKKIKKDDKMKYYDYLTNLKNRNYLTENIEKWNQNTIYPQTIVIVDLNNVKYINDTFGHAEGDNLIQQAANILIKTQLEDSEIIRTDGNEFLIYLVGHDEKQLSNYIHKLYRTFRELPHGYGAALGYSVIEDDLKLMDDAINEATLDMRTNKTNGAKDDKEN